MSLKLVKRQHVILAEVLRAPLHYYTSLIKHANYSIAMERVIDEPYIRNNLAYVTFHRTIIHPKAEYIPISTMEYTNYLPNLSATKTNDE